MTQPSIQSPARFVNTNAIGFADGSGQFALVERANPLPVTLARSAPGTPLAGSANASTVAGPFAAGTDGPIHLQLKGTWSGVVQLERSIDGGATRQPLTAAGQPWARFTGNANEAVWQESEAGATFYLAITLTAGTVEYRVSQ